MQKPREDSYYLSLLINTEYDMGRICPEALIFAGDQYELPFGEFDHKDEVYVRLKYQF